MRLSIPLKLLAENYAVVRLNPQEGVPKWFSTETPLGALRALTFTDDEISIICPQTEVPDCSVVDRDWRCLKIVGQLDLSLVGILATVLQTLAWYNIPILTCSTYNTDYIFVKDGNLSEAIDCLRTSGHFVDLGKDI